MNKTPVIKSVEYHKIILFLVCICMLFAFAYRINKAPKYPYYEEEVLSITAAEQINTQGIKVLAGEKLFSWNILAHSLLAASIRFFGTSEYSTRLISILASILVLPLIFVMGKKLYNDWVGLLAVVLLTMLSFQHQFAVSARYYSLLQFFFTLCVFAFYQGFVEGRNRYKILTVASFIAALLSHIIILEVLPAFLIFLYVSCKWNWLKDKSVLISVVIILLSVYFVLFYKFPADSISYQTTSLAPPVGVRLAKMSWGRPEWGDKLKLVNFLNQNPFYGIAVIILSLFYLFDNRKKAFAFYQVIFWGCLTGMSLVTHHKLATRYIYNLYPIYILLISYAVIRTVSYAYTNYYDTLCMKINSWPRMKIWQISIISVLALSFFLNITFKGQIGSTKHAPDLKPAHLYVKEHIVPGELLITSNVWLTEIYLRCPDYFIRQHSKVTTRNNVPYVDSAAKLKKIMTEKRQGIWIIADTKFYKYTGNELVSYVRKNFNVYYSSRKNGVEVYYR